jgi:hypothetical protein
MFGDNSEDVQHRGASNPAQLREQANMININLLTAKHKPKTATRDTSLEALESLDADILSRRQRLICDYIRQAGGATCWEVEQALELLHQSASSLIHQLFRKGQLVETDARRPTGSGRMAIVGGLPDDGEH